MRVLTNSVFFLSLLCVLHANPASYSPPTQPTFPPPPKGLGGRPLTIPDVFAQFSKSQVFPYDRVILPIPSNASLLEELGAWRELSLFRILLEFSEKTMRHLYASNSTNLILAPTTPALLRFFYRLAMPVLQSKFPKQHFPDNPFCPGGPYAAPGMHPSGGMSEAKNHSMQLASMGLCPPRKPSKGHSTNATHSSAPTSGGPTSGGPTSGGPTSGGSTSGGPTSGGPISGGSTSGGPTSGGPTSGGPISGGSTSGGPAPGGQTSGDPSSGSQTSGSVTSTGATSAGMTDDTPSVRVRQTGGSSSLVERQLTTGVSNAEGTTSGSQTNAATSTGYSSGAYTTGSTFSGHSTGSGYPIGPQPYSSSNKSDRPQTTRKDDDEDDDFDPEVLEEVMHVATQFVMGLEASIPVLQDVVAYHVVPGFIPEVMIKYTDKLMPLVFHGDDGKEQNKSMHDQDKNGGNKEMNKTMDGQDGKGESKIMNHTMENHGGKGENDHMSHTMPKRATYINVTRYPLSITDPQHLSSARRLYRQLAPKGGFISVIDEVLLPYPIEFIQAVLNNSVKDWRPKSPESGMEKLRPSPEEDMDQLQPSPLMVEPSQPISGPSLGFPPSFSSMPASGFGPSMDASVSQAIQSFMNSFAVPPGTKPGPGASDAMLMPMYSTLYAYFNQSGNFSAPPYMNSNNPSMAFTPSYNSGPAASFNGSTTGLFNLLQLSTQFPSYPGRDVFHLLYSRNDALLFSLLTELHPEVKQKIALYTHSLFPIHVFAPTDEAFFKLIDHKWRSLTGKLKDGKEMEEFAKRVDTMWKQITALPPIPEILFYHMLNTSLPPNHLYSHGPMRTLASNFSAKLDVSPMGVADMDKARPGRASIIATYPTLNGFATVVDRVLLPFDSRVLGVVLTAALRGSVETPTTRAESSDSCFPGAARVSLPRGGTMRMDALQAGDLILAGPGLKTPVIAFSHRHESEHIDFVKLLLSNGGSLTLSPGHYVYVDGRLRAAAAIEKGARLRREDGGIVTVRSMERVRGQGVYAPHTMHGDLVVDGVIVSGYTTTLHPSVAHLLLAPVRWAVRLGISKEPLGSLLYNGAGALSQWLPGGRERY